MKKLSLSAGLGACLALSMLAACDNKTHTPAPETRPQSPATVTIKTPEPGKPDHEASAPVDAADPTEDPKACDPNGGDEQCMLVPLKGCLGCNEKGGGHNALNMAAGRRIMESRKDVCMPIIKKLMEDMKNSQGAGAPPERSDHPSCQFNSATCSPQGKCVGKTLSEAELKAQWEKRRSQAPRNGQVRPS